MQTGGATSGPASTGLVDASPPSGVPLAPLDDDEPDDDDDDEEEDESCVPVVFCSPAPRGSSLPVGAESSSPAIDAHPKTHVDATTITRTLQPIATVIVP